METIMSNVLLTDNIVKVPRLSEYANVDQHETDGLLPRTDLLSRSRDIEELFCFSTKPNILITDNTVKISRLSEYANVDQHENDGLIPRSDLISRSQDIEGLFCLLRDKIDKEFLTSAKKLKVICTLSVGFDHIDIEECRRRSIKVGNTRDAPPESTAELCIALTLAVSRRLMEARDAAKNGGWTTWSPYWMCGKDISGSTIGILGLGRIGEAVASRIAAFEPERIVYHNRNKKQNCPYEWVSFEDLLAVSDILLVTMDASTVKGAVFDLDVFKKMKRNSIFINVSRGKLVDHKALYQALSEGIIGSAGLDVTDPEPFPTTDPLFQLPNCVILPHIGSASLRTRQEMIDMAESNIIKGLNGEPVVGPVP